MQYQLVLPNSVALVFVEENVQYNTEVHTGILTVHPEAPILRSICNARFTATDMSPRDCISRFRVLACTT